MQKESLRITGAAPVHLQLKGVGYRIGGARLLDEVNLTVHRGEVVTVIGPNGAGKTSLLNAISGEFDKVSGLIELAGVDITRQSVRRRVNGGVGRSFQTSSVFPGLPVSENVRLSVHARRRRGRAWSRQKRLAERSCVEQLLAKVNLLHARDSLAGSLSHGDQRRLEIALILSQEPELVLLDEPMAGAEPSDMASLAALIKGFAAAGSTVIMVEHRMDLVRDVSDRIAVMDMGKVILCSKPDVVMNDPRVRRAYLGQASDVA